jgi:hypothetical protein
VVKRAPEGESKRAKTVRLVDARTKKAIRMIRLIARLGGVGNRSHYDYGESDIDRIASALTEEVGDMVEKMRRPPRQMVIPFSLEGDGGGAS